MQEKKILFIPAWYPDDTNINSGNFVQDLALHLSSPTTIVHVAYLNWSYKHTPKYQQITSISDYLTEYRSKGFFPPRVGNITRFVAAHLSARHIIKVNSSADYDIVHIHGYTSLSVGLQVAEHYGAKVILSLHHKDIIDGDISPSLKKRLITELIKVDQLIVPSSAMKEGLAQHFSVFSKVAVIPNYIDVSNIAKKQSNTIARPSPINCLAVGTFNKNKNHTLLVDLWAQLPDNYRLTIVGEGARKREVQSLISQHGMTDRVRIVNPMPKARLMQEYAKYHVFVSTCTLESFCMTMLEAMAAGIPVVATTQGGPADFVTSANGVLTTAAAFVSDIQRTVESLDRYDPKQVRASVQHLSHRQVVRYYSLLYREL